jgi:hypothetical protein
VTNITRFLKCLAETKDKYPWQLVEECGRPGHVRTNEDVFKRLCPITAVYHHCGHGKISISKYEQAGRAIGLTSDESIIIAKAADNDYCDSRLRAKILVALGLNEGKA